MNTMGNPWLIMNMKLFYGDKQYNTKANRRKAIKTTMSESDAAEIKKNKTKLVDNRLLALIEKSCYIEM